MIAELRPYPAYRNSGVDWLGDIPVNWRLAKLKHVADLRASSVDRNQREGEVNIRFLGTDSVYHVSEIRDALKLETASVSTKEIHNYSLQEGDIVLTKDSVVPTRIANVSIVAEPLEDVVCGYHLTMIRPHLSSVHSRYLFWYLGCSVVNAYFLSKARGTTIIGLGSNAIGGAAFLGPSLTEQRAIARFLDHADQRLQRAIAAKEKRIALLEEQKQALVHEAVTGQIDVRTGKPYPAYKDCGVDWLREIPEHWSAPAAKRAFRESDDRSTTGTEELMSVSHMTGVTPRSEKNVTMFKAESHVGHKLCQEGDIVVNTMWAWMAALGLARQTGIVSPSYAVYRPRPSSRLVGDYVELLLRTTPYKREYRRRSTGIRPSRLRLYPDEFLRLPLLCPTRDEQHAIVRFVTARSAIIDQYVQKSNDAISHLNEYRTRLIADVVTGKLDVREAASRLPMDDPPGVSETRPGRRPRPPAAGGAGLKTGAPFPRGPAGEEHGG